MKHLYNNSNLRETLSNAKTFNTFISDLPLSFGLLSEKNISTHYAKGFLKRRDGIKQWLAVALIKLENTQICLIFYTVITE